ncbi:MAG: phage tail assembly protein [Planctomycetota bacterium]
MKDHNELAPPHVHVHKLHSPITFGSETITELRFREPKAKDLDDIPASGMTFGDLRRLAARLCGHPPTVLAEMSGKDTTEVYAVANELGGGSTPSGGTS